MPKLTKRTVEAAKIRETDYILFDDMLPGFGLRVYPSGNKSYIVQYRASRRKFRRMKLGRHGILTCEQARDRAIQILAEVAQGGDPQGDRQHQKTEPTLVEFCERVIAEHSSIHCKPGTVTGYRQLIRTYIAPRIGDMRLSEIKRPDIATFHHDLRYAPYPANRCMQFLSKAFNLAELWGLRDDGSNPCRHIQRYKEKKRERFLSTEELARLGQTLRRCEEEGLETPSAIRAIRLLLLTGCRLGEIMTLKWDWVDLDAGVLNLPDSKTGAKTVWLGQPAIDLLKASPRDSNNPHVITGRKPGAHLTDLQHPWRRIRRRAEIDDVRIHDLRHTFASVAASTGHGLPMIGKLLGHTQTQTTARYAHLASAPVRQAADAVSDCLATALQGCDQSF